MNGVFYPVKRDMISDNYTVINGYEVKVECMKNMAPCCPNSICQKYQTSGGCIYQRICYVYLSQRGELLSDD